MSRTYVHVCNGMCVSNPVHMSLSSISPISPLHGHHARLIQHVHSPAVKTLRDAATSPLEGALAHGVGPVGRIKHQISCRT